MERAYCALSIAYFGSVIIKLHYVILLLLSRLYGLTVKTKDC